MDTVSKEKRSEIMRSVKSKQTKPELVVRKLLFSMGYRYRLHVKQLPGTPDIVFTRKKKVIWVNGCFWHSHNNCRLARLPKSRQEYWHAKLQGNARRDEYNISKLIESGWEVITVWECELNNIEAVKKRLLDFLVI